MQLTSTSLRHQAPIDPRYAFADIDPQTHVAHSANLSPQLAWSGVPEGTRSLVLICVDGDVPSRPDDVNQEGRQVPADLPRTDFYHWLMVDIPPSVSELAEGACCQGVTARGKQAPPGPPGSRQGLNDYTGWFAGDKDMEGPYLGYDGPCPPFNDSIPHRYVFTLLALDVPALALQPGFTHADLQQAVEGHVLAQATLTGRYATNPDIRLR